MDLINGRIIGGEKGKIEDFPYQATLLADGKAYCGATVIAEKYLLTAAHCIKSGKTDNLTVTAGTTTRELDENVQIRKVGKFIRHEQFDQPKKSHDITILILDEPLVFNEFVQPAKLPQREELLEDGTEVTISGWGKQAEGFGAESNVLRFTVVSIRSKRDCWRAYWERFTVDMMCAGTGRKDSCQGDSGGPMVNNGTLYGIISWGHGCGRPKSPGVYARVSYFIDWIHQHIEL